VPWRSKHPLLTGHTRRAPLVEIRHTLLPSPKPVCKLQSNTLYETNHSAYGPMIIYNNKQGHYSDHRICKMMVLNEINHNIATSTYLKVVCLVLKSPHTQNMLLRIESTGRHTHQKKVKVVCYYIQKEIDNCKVKIITFVIWWSVCHGSQCYVKYPDIMQIC
jgi:hypothetical protein